MFWTRLTISLIEFLLSALLAVFITFWSYRSFDRFNHAYNAQEEIYKGNVAVAILMAALMYGAALIMRESIYPVISIVTVWFTGDAEGGHSLLLMAGYAFGHLVFGFLLSVGCVQLAMKLFGWLNREIDENEQIASGNVSVAIIMSAVILIVSMFMQQGVGALTKSLIPQPKLGVLRMMD
ncbi:MAG: DUF350 domain-containing protein [Elusimicrobiota bacterium]